MAAERAAVEGGTGPTYAANFAVLICEGSGDKQLGRIWAGPEKRLVFDPSTQKLESGSIKFYDGAEDQLPDPLMESHLGAGNVPAYRGYAYIVIENFDVSKSDGNRIPFLTIEVGQKDTSTPGSTAPENLGIAFFDKMMDGGSYFITTYNGSYYGVLKHRKSDMVLMHNRLLGGWEPTQYLFYDVARDTVVRQRPGDPAGTYTTLVMDTGVTTEHSTVLGIEAGSGGKGACMANSKYVFAFNRPSSGGIRFYTVNPATNTLLSTQTFDAAGSALQFLYGAASTDGFVWGITADGNVRRFDLDGTSTASVVIGAAPANFGGDNAGRFDPNTGWLWMYSRNVSDASIAYSVVSSTALISFGTTPSIFNGVSGWLFEPGAAYLFGNRWLAVDHYMPFDAGGSPMSEEDGVYVGTADLQQAMYNDATNLLVGVRYGGAYAISTGTDPASIPASTGYMGGVEDSTGGSTTLSYQTLAEVVTDLSLRAGLTADQIDVTQLTDQVDGYIIANQVSVKDALALLMPAYYFDAAEDQGKIKFVKRGGDIAVVIPDDALGAHPSDQEGSDLYETTRVMDEELPSTLSVNYVLAATKYSPASKYARRLVGYSGDEQRMEFAMVFTDEKALHIAHVNLHDQWISRLRRKLSLGLEYAYLMPTDLIGVGGYGMRITQMTQKGAYFELETVRDDSDTYTPNIIVTETPPPDETVSQPSLTLLELM
jgi:hypothetical protein